MDDPLENDALDDEAIDDARRRGRTGVDGRPTTRREDGEAGISVEDLGLPMPVLPEDAALELLRRRRAARRRTALGVLQQRACCAVVSAGDLEAACIYKPVAGERPLHDFPDGTLARREVAAFAVSRASGWGIVPPTVLRDGPFGEGMVQLWIRHGRRDGPGAAGGRVRPAPAADRRLRRRGQQHGPQGRPPGPGPRRPHLRRGPRGDVLAGAQAADRALGLARATVPRPRSPSVLRALRAGLDEALGEDLRALLDPIEVSATARRLDRLLDAGVFPQPDPRWPAMPWPPV